MYIYLLPFFLIDDQTWIQLHPHDGDTLESKVVWPQGRHFHSAVTYRRQMIIYGGKSNGYMNDIYSFDYSELAGRVCVSTFYSLVVIVTQKPWSGEKLYRMEKNV